MSIPKVGLVASIPALCGFAGGMLGGIVSDNLLRRGFSLTVKRNILIVLGMLLATSIILCNYTDNTVVMVALMALAFFCKDFGALVWPVLADTAPKEMIGYAAGCLTCSVTLLPSSLFWSSAICLKSRTSSTGAGVYRLLCPGGNVLLSGGGRQNQTSSAENPDELAGDQPAGPHFSSNVC